MLPSQGPGLVTVRAAISPRLYDYTLLYSSALPLLFLYILMSFFLFFNHVMISGVLFILLLFKWSLIGRTDAAQVRS